jgi:hypothetical protein
VEAAEAWRAQATPADAELLDTLPTRWNQALEQARAARLTRRVSAEGALLDPKTALARAAPAPGPYGCRVIRFPAPGTKMRWDQSANFFCFVGAEADGPSLTVDGVPQRLGGYLFEEKGGTRLVFLGAARTRRGALAAYGDAAGTNAIGMVERIGDFRYRLTVPQRGGGLAVYEMVASPR